MNVQCSDPLKPRGTGHPVEININESYQKIGVFVPVAVFLHIRDPVLLSKAEDLEIWYLLCLGST